MDGSISFGQWVRRRRKALDLTQEELARRVACSLAMVKKIEADARRPSTLMAGRLAECLQIPPESRPAFIQSARLQRSPDRLPPAHELAPPSTKSPSPPGNLPAPVARLAGRQEELAALRDRLADPQTRLLTLTGPGGVGKTRLALEAAAGSASRFPGGAWLVELAPLSDPALVAQQAAAAFDLREAPGKPWLDLLAAALQGEPALLLLDNCEHLVESCARLAAALLALCPHLTVLATGREPLRIPGEIVWPVPPLALPDLSDLPPAGQLARVGSVALFVERARSALPSFSLGEENAAAIAEICVRLDGLPLALELAAARLRALSPQAIASRLGEGGDDRAALRLLSGGRAGAPRHRALRAALDWSHDLLSEPEQILFRRLSVFAGGFTLEAAGQVCTGDILVPGDVLEGLVQLVDKSLVSVKEEQGGERRYHLLETIRQYAAEKLLASGEQDALRDRHFACCLRLVEAIEPELKTATALQRLDLLEAELDNLRLALDWSFREDRPESSPVSPALGLRLASLPSRLWSDRCYFSEGRAWIERGLARVDEGDPALAGLVASALSAAAVLAYEQYEIAEARRLLERSIAISRSAGSEKALCEALIILAKLVYFEREPELAHALIEESLGISRGNGDRWNEAMALSIQGGFSYWRAGDHDTARRLTEESIRIFLETGDRWEADANYSQLAAICVRAGEAEQARAYIERAIGSYREMKDSAALAFALEIQGDAAYLQRDYATALASLQEALRLRRSLGHQEWALSLVSWLGLVLVEMGEIERGAEHLAEHLSLAGAEGQARILGGDLIGWAGVVLARGEAAWAARLLGYVSRLYEDEHFHPGGPELALFDRAEAAVRARLDGQAFRAAWAEGRRLPAGQAGLQAARAAAWLRGQA